MTRRNLVPRPQPTVEIVQAQDVSADTIAELADSTQTTIDSIISFLEQEHPRGPMPIGPKAPGVTQRSSANMVFWSGDSSSDSTVDYYSVWRANAGTVSSPTTPLLGAANRVAIIASARRGNPGEQGISIGRGAHAAAFAYFDLDFSTTARVQQSRYRYWVSSIDNEFRESVPSDAGISTVPPLPYTIEDEGVPLPVRAIIDFQGLGVTATDDGATKTIVTIPGGGGAGSMGPQGPPGLDGQDGIDGQQGLPGITGATGPAGVAGPMGAQGPPGIDGQDGIDGDTGAPGAAGAAGVPGPTGDSQVIWPPVTAAPWEIPFNAPNIFGGPF